MRKTRHVLLRAQPNNGTAASFCADLKSHQEKGEGGGASELLNIQRHSCAARLLDPLLCMCAWPGIAAIGVVWLNDVPCSQIFPELSNPLLRLARQLPDPSSKRGIRMTLLLIQVHEGLSSVHRCSVGLESCGKPPANWHAPRG